MITLKSSEENVVEKDQQSDGQSVEEEDSQGGKRTTKETSSDKTSIYEQKSDGTQVPYVSKKLSPEVEGVIVIADGGGNAVVVQNITGAIQALYGVEAHKIKVMKRNVAGTE
jgi:stage III sporulation protein AG